MKEEQLIYIRNCLSTVDPIISRRILAIAVGMKAAVATQLPSSIVDNTNTYFDSMLKDSAKAYIFEVNESIVIDTDLACNVAKKYFNVRYNTIYPNKDILILGIDSDVFDRVGGVMFSFSPEEYEFMVLHSDIITKLIISMM